MATCSECQHYTPMKTQAPEMGPIKVKEPWELVGVDLIGPLPVSDEGYRYICTFVDLYTKCVDFFPLKDMIAYGVFRWSNPGRILSDQGSEFCASINDELCKSYEIQRSITSTYHPQTNGLAERTNKTLKTRLAKLCNETMSDWLNFLEEVAHSIHTQKQRSNGFTPFQLMFTCEHQPLDQSFEDLVELPSSEDIAIKEQNQKHEELHFKREQKVEAAQEKQKAESRSRKTKGVKAFNISVQIKVLKRNLCSETWKGEKMEPKWTGPYKVLDIDSSNHVALETVKNDKKLRSRIPYNNP